MKMRSIEAEWIGSYPTLCFGEWVIKIDGVRMKDNTEDTILKRDMNTYGDYSNWCFDEDYSEVWKDYTNGLNYADWVKNDPGKALTELLKKNGIELTEDEIKELYNKLQQQDFRSGSCGGCI